MIVERVDDLDDARLVDYRLARDPAGLARRGVFVAEGRLVVRRLLAATRFRPRSVLATAPALAGLRDLLERSGVSVYVAGRDTIAGIVGYPFHRGCLAVGEEREALSLEALLAAEPTAPRLLVVLDRVTGPDNLGGVFRNALAFGAGAVLLSPGCADPLYRRALRASVGAALVTPFVRLADWAAGLARLRAAGFALVALTPEAEATELPNLGRTGALPARVALLVGTEAEGLGAAARAAADVAVRIAMAPGADSLNLATASGIALHHLAVRLGLGDLSVPPRGVR